MYIKIFTTLLSFDDSCQNRCLACFNAHSGKREFFAEVCAQRRLIRFLILWESSSLGRNFSMGISTACRCLNMLMEFCFQQNSKVLITASNFGVYCLVGTVSSSRGRQKLSLWALKQKTEKRTADNINSYNFSSPVFQFLNYHPICPVYTPSGI